jgi:hypothetical protein
VVEQSAVNRSVVGSNPTCGAILESCPSGRRSTIGNRVDGQNLSQGFESLALRHRKLRPLGQVVKTPPFHGGNTGSNPVGVTKTWRISSAGRASALQAEGRRFDPVILHHIKYDRRGVEQRALLHRISCELFRSSCFLNEPSEIGTVFKI